MDFLRISRSLEGLLYEVVGWLVFYPRTLWRIVALSTVLLVLK